MQTNANMNAAAWPAKAQMHQVVAVVLCSGGRVEAGSNMLLVPGACPCLTFHNNPGWVQTLGMAPLGAMLMGTLHANSCPMARGTDHSWVKAKP